MSPVRLSVAVTGAGLVALIAFGVSRLERLRTQPVDVADEAVWISLSLAGAAVLACILVVIALLLAFRQRKVPVQALLRTMRRIDQGDHAARVAPAEAGEFAELAQALNTLLDEQRHTEARLHEQQARLEHRERILVESQRVARIGSWRRPVDGNLLELSAEAYRILGLPLTDATLTAEAFHAMVHPDDRERLLAEHDDLLNHGGTRLAEVCMVRSGGEQRHVELRAELEHDAAGNPAHLSGTIQDITERYQAEQHLRQYEKLIEGSQDLVCVIDHEYRYVMANQAYADLFGLDRSEIEGVPLRVLRGEAYFDNEARPPIDRCLAGEPQVFEAEPTYPGAGVRQLLIRYYPITSPDGAIRQVGCVATDLTELKQAKAELRRQSELLRIGGQVARFGGWSINLTTQHCEWTDMVAEMHGMPRGHSPTIEEAIGFYVPEHRGRIREVFARCVEQGVGYDEELQILAATGERRWIRTTGVPVRDNDGAVVRVEGALQDVSERREADERLQRYRQLVEGSRDFCVITDSDHRYVLANEAYAAHYGIEQGQIEGMHVADLLGREFFDRDLKPRLDQCLAGVEQQFEIARDHPSLGHRHLLVRYFPIASPDHQRCYVGSVITDTTELKEAEAELHRSHDQLTRSLETRQALVNSLPAHIALLDADGTIIDINEQWSNFGMENACSDSGVGIGVNYLEVCRRSRGEHAEEASAVMDGLEAVLAGRQKTFTLEYPCHSPAELRWFRLMANRLVSDGAEGERFGAVVMHIDVTERKLAEEKLNRLAYEDPVTGMLTRQGFVRAFERYADTVGWGRLGMVVMLDIEGQRNVNDAHGYDVGDKLLATIGGRLHEQAVRGGIAARVSGDEFVVFLPHEPERDPEDRRRALAAVFDESFKLGELRIDASAQFGYTLLGAHRRDAESVLQEAELALLEARSRRVREWSAYTSRLAQDARERIDLTRELRTAIDEDQFELRFQPKVDLASGTLTGSEVLLRWNHPERGVQSPGRFIPIAEKSQLIIPIGDWALLEACRLLREWQDAGLELVRIAVNVSVVQFRLGNFTDKVRTAITRYDIDPSRLTLEITESVFEQEPGMLQKQLRELHELGVRLSLDDFGTGYSSLLYLQQYAFDEIKIDMGFVNRILDDPYSRKIVITVLGIAGALGADAVAEGVESAAVRDELLGMGCRIGQGYYFSRPLTVEGFRSLLETRSSLPPPEVIPRQQSGGL